MLPKEGIGDVARCLPRWYLDAILTSNGRICRGIQSASEPHDTSDATRRRVSLEVEALQGGSIKMTLTASKSVLPGSDQSNTDQKQIICHSAESFHTATRNCFITVMHINVNVMRPTLFSILMKEAHRWRSEGILEEHPPSFPSRNDFHHFFDELVVTQGKLTFDIFRNLPFTVETPRFWNLEAVRQCQWLAVDHIPPQMGRPFSTATALQWLHIPPSTLNYKRLYFHQSMLSEPLEQFCIGIHTEFANASAPNQFRIRIRLQNRVLVPKEPLENAVDELLIMTTEENGGYLAILRILREAYEASAKKE